MKSPFNSGESPIVKDEISCINVENVDFFNYDYPV